MRGSFRQALSFQEVRKKTDHYARVLKESGVEKGDRVAVFLPKTPGGYIAILSVIKVGAIAVPLFEAVMEEAGKDRVDDGRATVLVAGDERRRCAPRKTC